MEGGSSAVRPQQFSKQLTLANPDNAVSWLFATPPTQLTDTNGQDVIRAVLRRLETSKSMPPARSDRAGGLVPAAPAGFRET
ncbi:hypothetical protein MOKP126_49800 [Mycobacterium avium subsp. hominissuis]